MSYYKLGDRERALSELKDALKLDPRFSGSEQAKQALASLDSRSTPK